MPVPDIKPGVGEAWFIASNKIHESACVNLLAKTDVMQKVVDENGLWRVQAEEDWPAALKLRASWALLRRYAEVWPRGHGLHQRVRVR